MKRNDLLIIIATIAYSVLFYNQLLGINLLIFNLILFMLLIYRDITILKSKAFLLSALLSLITSFACYWHNSNFSIVMNMISLLITASTAMNKDNSILINMFHALFSYLTILGYMIYDIVTHKIESANTANTNSTSFSKKLLLSILPLFMVFIFFLLYRQSNIAFKNITDQINFDFISFPWIGFTFLGFILLYAFFKQRAIKYLAEKDILKSDDLINIYDLDYKDWFQNIMSFKSEYLTGIILFGIINLLTLSVNITDIMYTWSANTLPEGITFSEYIHSGIASLIGSIILAMLIILFYFRGAINFYQNNKMIKSLAFLWMIQNIFLVVSTLWRNKMYVDTYSLTEKRVGVFIYLGLCIIGLLLCIYKIAKKKNNIFLFRKNMWAIYISLAVLSVFDWSYCIAAYNIYRTKKTNNFYLDASYMGDLNENNLAVVWNYYQTLPDSDFRKAILKEIMDRKIQTILSKYEKYNFQSMTYQRHKLALFILSLDQKQQIKSLNISNQGLQNLNHIKQLTNIENLDLSNNQLIDLSVLHNFSDLKEINLAGNTFDSIKKMPTLTQLEKLNMSNTSSNDLNKITLYKNLKSLDISNNTILSLNGIEQFNQLNDLDISNNPILDLEILTQLFNLQNIKLTNVLNSDKALPFISNLKSIDLSNSNNNYKQFNFIIDERLLNQLQALNLNDARINNISFLEKISENNQLEKLSISNNQLKNLTYLTKLNKLKELDISNNDLSKVEFHLPSALEILNLSNTNFINSYYLSDVPLLKEIYLDYTNIEYVDSIQLNHLQILSALNCQNINQLDRIDAPNLKELNILQCNCNSDYSFMKKYKSLEVLQISSIDASLGKILLQLKHLKKIECFSIDEQTYNQLISANPSIWIIRNDHSRYTSSESSIDSF